MCLDRFLNVKAAAFNHEKAFSVNAQCTTSNFARVCLKLYSRSLDVPHAGNQHPDPVLGLPGRGEAGQRHGPHHGEGEHGGTLDHHGTTGTL